MVIGNDIAVLADDNAASGAGLDVLLHVNVGGHRFCGNLYYGGRRHSGNIGDAHGIAGIIDRVCVLTAGGLHGGNIYAAAGAAALGQLVTQDASPYAKPSGCKDHQRHKDCGCFPAQVARFLLLLFGGRHRGASRYRGRRGIYYVLIRRLIGVMISGIPLRLAVIRLGVLLLPARLAVGRFCPLPVYCILRIPIALVLIRIIWVIVIHTDFLLESILNDLF